MKAMNEFPTTASERVQTVINNAPCFIPIDYYNAPDSTTDDDSETDDSHNHYYYGSWDRDAYAAAFAELWDELEYQEYRAFYKAYRTWEHEHYYDWWKNDNW